MRGPRSLNSLHFVVAGPGRSRPLLARGVFAPCLAALLLGGCARPDASRPVEDSETSGRISIASAPDVRALAVVEAGSFKAAYAQATIELREAESSGQVVSALLAGRADGAFAGRELEQEERDMARRSGIELEGHRIAQDAMCIVVPAANPVQNVTLGELQRIWLGDLAEWSALGGTGGRILPVLPPLSSDLARAFAQRVMNGQPMRAPAFVEDSDSAVADRVRALPGSIGVVPLSLASAPGLKPLRVAPLEGAPYVDPDMESVHDGSYPLTRYLNFYIRTHGPRLAGGFVTYVCSQPGQQLVLDSGRVPTAVPLRFVRRSPLLSTH